MESIYINRPQAYPFRRPHYVYRVYSYDETLLYIGSAYDVMGRIEAHSREAHWFDWAHRVDIEEFSDKGQALAAEKAAILTECPIGNTKWTGRDRGNSTRNELHDYFLVGRN